MKYTELMDKIKLIGAEFKVSPDAGFIKVSLMSKDTVLAESNIGWYSFRDSTIESFIHVYEQYALTVSLPSSNGSKTLNETNDGN